MFSQLIGSKALPTCFQRVEQIQKAVLHGLSTARWIWIPIGMYISFLFFGFRWSFLFLDGRQPTQGSRFLRTTGVGMQGYRGWFFGSELSCKDRIEGFFYWLYSVVFCIIIISEMIYVPPFWLYAPPFWLYIPLFLSTTPFIM